MFDVRRDTHAHLGFGFGSHCCIGASIARLEVRVALEEMLARIPDFVVEEDGVARVHSDNVRGFSALPIRFTPSG